MPWCSLSRIGTRLFWLKVSSITAALGSTVKDRYNGTSGETDALTDLAQTAQKLGLRGGDAVRSLVPYGSIAIDAW